MLFNLAIIIMFAMFFSYVFEKIKLPGLLGMLLTGVLLGNYMKQIIFGVDYNGFFSNFFISADLSKISGELRTAALIVILIRAGLGINKKTLNKIGIPAIKMSFIPGITEGLAILLLSHYLFKLPIIEAGILAFIIAAVSPAVVVPQMLNLKEKRYGEKKEIPTLILAGASVDDVFAITIFSAFLGMTASKSEKLSILNEVLKIPISIIIGIVMGAILGFLLLMVLNKLKIRNTKKALIFMMIAIIFHHLEETKIIPVASLLGIMTMGFVILEKNSKLAKKMAKKFNMIWVFSEIILFVLIGAEVNIGVVFGAGLKGILLIFIGLLARSLGVWISLLKSSLNTKERVFCMIAYIPKATVQAAIGGLALTMVRNKEIILSNGVETGQLILALAVLSIVITAPLGAVGINSSAKYLLEREQGDLENEQINEV